MTYTNRLDEIIDYGDLYSILNDTVNKYSIKLTQKDSLIFTLETDEETLWNVLREIKKESRNVGYVCSIIIDDINIIKFMKVKQK